jgi:3-phosphoshikimate 1-carboxyvinyltransferase
MSSTKFAHAERRLYGELWVPPDKSISHRSALIAAMGKRGQRTEIDGYLDAADTRSTLDAVRAVGAGVVIHPVSSVVVGGGHLKGHRTMPAGHPGLALCIEGVGLQGVDSAEIDVGNAGTLLRLLPGWLAGQVGGEWKLDGDESIRRRPVDRIASPLREMGADLSAREDRLPPLEVRGEPLRGITYEMPIASAQVKSCLLFAGLLADSETQVVEPHPSRDHTEIMLEAAGASIERTGDAVVVHPAAEELEPGEIAVPADISSAAFFIVAATLVKDSDVVLLNVGINPTRTGLLDILKRMGATIEFLERREVGGEPIADLRVKFSSLRKTEVEGAEIPLAIDELPLVALAACFAEGTTVIRDAEELRRKESDRIETVTAALRALGGVVHPTAGGMVIEGTGGLRGGTIESHGDHRIAMLGAVAGLASKEGVEVVGMDAAAVSYPGFEADLASLLTR